MLATLKRNVGELFRSELSSLPLALLCTTFYRCSDIQLVNAEIWAKIQRTQSQFAQHLCQHFLIQQAPLLTNRVWCQFLSSHGIDKSRTLFTKETGANFHKIDWWPFSQKRLGPLFTCDGLSLMPTTFPQPGINSGQVQMPNTHHHHHHHHHIEDMIAGASVHGPNIQCRGQRFLIWQVLEKLFTSSRLTPSLSSSFTLPYH